MMTLFFWLYVFCDIFKTPKHPDVQVRKTERKPYKIKRASDAFDNIDSFEGNF